MGSGPPGGKTGQCGRRPGHRSTNAAPRSRARGEATWSSSCAASSRSRARSPAATGAAPWRRRTSSRPPTSAWSRPCAGSTPPAGTRLDVRRADDPRRGQAPVPRRDLAGARAATGAGARAGGARGRDGADGRARPHPPGRRDRRAPPLGRGARVESMTAPARSPASRSSIATAVRKTTARRPATGSATSIPRTSWSTAARRSRRRYRRSRTTSGAAAPALADERTFGEIGRELALTPGQAAKLVRRSVRHLSALAA